MSIRFTRAYVDSTGKPHGTMEEAQEAELWLIVAKGNIEDASSKIIAQAIMANRAAILDILTMTDASRPGARGVRKPRKPKTEPVAQPAA